MNEDHSDEVVGGNLKIQPISASSAVEIASPFLLLFELHSLFF